MWCSVRAPRAPVLLAWRSDGVSREVLVVGSSRTTSASARRLCRHNELLSSAVTAQRHASTLAYLQAQCGHGGSSQAAAAPAAG